MYAYMRRKRQKEDQVVLDQMLKEKKAEYEKKKKIEIQELKKKLKELES